MPVIKVGQVYKLNEIIDIAELKIKKTYKIEVIEKLVNKFLLRFYTDYNDFEIMHDKDDFCYLIEAGCIELDNNKEKNNNENKQKQLEVDQVYTVISHDGWEDILYKPKLGHSVIITDIYDDVIKTDFYDFNSQQYDQLGIKWGDYVFIKSIDKNLMLVGCSTTEQPKSLENPTGNDLSEIIEHYREVCKNPHQVKTQKDWEIIFLELQISVLTDKVNRYENMIHDLIKR